MTNTVYNAVGVANTPTYLCFLICKYSYNMNNCVLQLNVRRYSYEHRGYHKPYHLHATLIVWFILSVARHCSFQMVSTPLTIFALHCRWAMYLSPTDSFVRGWDFHHHHIYQAIIWSLAQLVFLLVYNIV